MTKLRLTPCTIIPPELYVERAADRQLKTILDDMGRPGYVLVARQMGKTNLLLHAKREFSDSDTSFCYVDVSNVVPSVRSFFRSVIDACIDGLPDRFNRASKEIFVSRESVHQLLPHREHELELLALLRSTAGRVVICLDEIDALTKTDYSDQVFSLVRSIYFSGRTNFPEFSRLTYLLSGVAEPSEIIRNRAVSPFNIGEKIQLEDFTFAETREFLRKAGLLVDDAAARRIYYWTGGAPRLVWEVCAAIELEQEAAVSVVSIDKIVESKYLRSFDLPPVDHIRTLVEADKDLRHGIMAIHYHRVASIADSVKNKLYLAGVTSVSASSGELKFKCKIIEETVSEKWLNEIAVDGVAKRDEGSALLRQRRYSQALACFEVYEFRVAVIESPEVYFFEKGKCLYHVGRYEEALASFEHQTGGMPCDLDQTLAQSILISKIWLNRGEYDKCSEVLSEIMDRFAHPAPPTHIHHFCEASLTLCSVLLEGVSVDASKARELARRVIDLISDFGSGNQGLDAVERISCFAYYYLFRSNLLLGERSAAGEALGMAIFCARGQASVILTLERSMLLQSGGEQLAQLKLHVELLIEQRVPVLPVDAESPLVLSVPRVAELMRRLARGNQSTRASLGRLLRYLNERSIGHSISVYELVFISSLEGTGEVARDVSTILFGIASRLPRCDVETGWRRNVIQFALLMPDPPDIAELGHVFMDEYLSKDDFTLKPGDVTAIYVFISRWILGAEVLPATDALRQMRLAIDRSAAPAVVAIDDGRAEIDDRQSFFVWSRLVFETLELMLRKAIGESIYYGDVVRLYSDIEICAPVDRSEFNVKFKNALLQEMSQLSPRGSILQQNRLMLTQLGRNQVVEVRLTGGKNLIGKVKKLESILKRGEAVIVKIH